MTNREVDLSVIVSENRRMTHAGIPASPVRSDRVRLVPVPVRKNPTGYNSAVFLNTTVSYRSSKRRGIGF